MIVYEVNLEVDAAVAGPFGEWLAVHVREMLTLPGFVSATWYRELDRDEPGDARWCVQYQLASRADLEEYFTVHAERMRGEGLAHFADRFRASRRVLEPVEAFEAG